MAGRQGFEPRFYGPEPHVLPLDDLPAEVSASGPARPPGRARQGNGIETSRSSETASRERGERVSGPASRLSGMLRRNARRIRPAGRGAGRYDLRGCALPLARSERSERMAERRGSALLDNALPDLARGIRRSQLALARAASRSPPSRQERAQRADGGEARQRPPRQCPPDVARGSSQPARACASGKPKPSLSPGASAASGWRRQRPPRQCPPDVARGFVAASSRLRERQAEALPLARSELASGWRRGATAPFRRAGIRRSQLALARAASRSPSSRQERACEGMAERRDSALPDSALPTSRGDSSQPARACASGKPKPSLSPGASLRADGGEGGIRTLGPGLPRTTA
jgi:hypothetical protein